ncbi:MAG: endolytic transglycosylase MltG [Oscillospiraceae bacterium]|nr:endolytic transglycosylase MltG [Oscillospiraceae bacterium]
MANKSGDNRHDTASWDAGKVRQGAAQERNRRNRRKKFPLGVYFTCVVLASVLLAGVGWLLVNDLCSLSKAPVTTVITVDEGDSVGAVAGKLKDAGLINYKWFFQLMGGFLHAKETIDPGEYELNSDMDYRCLIQSMHNYASAATVRVTIQEGLTVNDVIDILVENEVSTREDLEDAAANVHYAEYPFLDDAFLGDINRMSGYLFPDTYDFYVHENAVSALGRMLNNFKQRTAELEQDIKASHYSLDEIVTIASLIEKESGSTDDYATFSSVIYNRLGAGWKLQIDATINFIKNTSTLNITYDDLKIDSPYNTYLYDGLPAGPICNPSLKSIEAALHPNQTSYWYWYAHDGVTHFFTNSSDFTAYVDLHPNQ